MDKVVVNIQEPRNEWSAPELKKVDIEQITATGVKFTLDGNGGS
jgi:hypothetical protein